MNFLDRNEFNFEPSQKVKDAIKNFDPKDLRSGKKECGQRARKRDLWSA